MNAPDLLICTRFGLRVRDLGWLRHRLELISAITRPSLMNQDDQNFYWAILTDDGLPNDIREELTELLRAFDGRAFLCKPKRGGPGSLVEFAKDRLRLQGDQQLLTGRLDDDDAWTTSMVGAVRQHVASWLRQPERAPGVTFTFQDGLEWIMYEMIDVERLTSSGERVVHAPAIHKYSLPFIGTSVFVCSPLSLGATSMSGSHPKVAANLAAKHGFATKVLTTQVPMWLCCRHKQAGSGIGKARGEEVHANLKDLAKQFGLDEKRVQHYLNNESQHQYTLLKAPLTKKGELAREWRRIQMKVDDPATDPDERSGLKRRQEDLGAQMRQLEENVLGDPGPMTDRA